MSKQYIIFAGDSFTWGEGLQLYFESDYWEKQRNIHNEWSQLSEKITPETETLRQQLRFSRKVAEYFDSGEIVCRDNGGQFENPINFVEKMIQKYKNKIKFIVFQFTTLERSNLHHPAAKQICNCPFCESCEKPHYFLYNIFKKKIENVAFSQYEKDCIYYLETVEGIPVNKILSAPHIDMEMIFDFFYKKYFENNIKIFVEDYLTEWIKNYDVYFIDSWSSDTSKIINRYDVITNRLIPLIGEDGKEYKNWKLFEKSFRHKDIHDEFRGTHNHHPTKLQHQKIGESIIKFVNEKKF